MTGIPLDGLVIRTATVRQPGMGYIFAADPDKEAEDIPHAITLRYHDGAFVKGEANFDAHALALVTEPELGLICVSGAGYYSAIMTSGTASGDIFDDSAPAPASPRVGGIRSVAAIGGRAHAVGLRGMVYRLDEPKLWTRLDEGLPATFDAQAVGGFGDGEIYSVGHDGAIWRFDGHRWFPCESPTSATLTAVTCAPDGFAYAAGHKGVLLRGRLDSWTAVNHAGTSENIWDLAWFADALYASTMTDVHRLGGDSRLEPVDFGTDRPRSCYQLSTAEGVMWSNGEFDLMSFDGTHWTRIV